MPDARLRRTRTAYHDDSGPPVPVRRLIWWLGLIGVLSFGYWLDSFLR
jgi:hypothetical protein